MELKIRHKKKFYFLNDDIYNILSYLLLDDKLKFLETLIKTKDLFVKYINKSFDFDIINVKTCTLFIKNNCFSLLKLSRLFNYKLEFTSCYTASENGNLEILQWLRSQNPPCFWNEETCAIAARNGHLNLLKWCKKNRCPWNKKICSSAAFGGHLEILQWYQDELKKNHLHP